MRQDGSLGTNHQITTVPRVQRLDIRDVGSVEDVSLSLSPGLNVLLGLGGPNENRILDCLVAAITGSPPDTLVPLLTEHSRIKVELPASVLTYARAHSTVPPLTDPRCHQQFPADGDRALAALHQAVSSASASSLVLIDDQITGFMDHTHWKHAVEILKSSPSQILIVLHESQIADLHEIPHRRFRIELEHGRASIRAEE